MKYMKFYVEMLIIAVLFTFVFSLAELDFDVYTKTRKLMKKMEVLTNLHKDVIKENTIKQISGLKDIYTMDNTTLLRYYDIRRKGGETNKDKIFIMAGEHPREMIAVEALYNFIEDLLTNQKKYDYILDNYDIRFVLVANPYSRLKVEKGEYCRRLNPNGVDLNRNWDIYWGKNIQLGEENPGKKPFSEVETRFLKHLIKDLEPKIFLTLHSGVYGLYMPHAFIREEGELNGKAMKEVLTEIKEKFCSICQVGAPSKNIGYQSSGTCLDYAYEKLKVPYSFVWEIYTNEKKFEELENYRKKHNKTGKKKKSQIKKKPSFLETDYSIQMSNEEKLKFLNKRKFTSKQNDFCLYLFNPLDEVGVRFIKKHWTKSLKYFLERMIGM